MNVFPDINMDIVMNIGDYLDFVNLSEEIRQENELDSQKTYLNLGDYGWPDSYFNPDDIMAEEGGSYENVEGGNNENVQPNANEVDVTPVKTVNKTKKGRQRLEEREKQRRRKESNRRAAEKYRSKKKKEQMNIFEKHEHLKDVVKEFLSSVKDHLVTHRIKTDSKLLQCMTNAEQALKLTH